MPYNFPVVVNEVSNLAQKEKEAKEQVPWLQDDWGKNPAFSDSHGHRQAHHPATTNNVTWASLVG